MQTVHLNLALLSDVSLPHYEAEGSTTVLHVGMSQRGQKPIKSPTSSDIKTRVSNQSDTSADTRIVERDSLGQIIFGHTRGPRGIFRKLLSNLSHHLLGLIPEVVQNCLKDVWATVMTTRCSISKWWGCALAAHVGKSNCLAGQRLKFSACGGLAQLEYQDHSWSSTEERLGLSVSLLSPISSS